MPSVAALATDRVGAKDRSILGATVPPDPGPLPAPGDGLPLLPWVTAIGGEVWPEAAGVGLRTGTGGGRRQLQEREIDPGALARSAADSRPTRTATGDRTR